MEFVENVLPELVRELELRPVGDVVLLTLLPVYSVTVKAIASIATTPKAANAV